LTCPAGPEALGLGSAEGDFEGAGVAVGRGLVVGFEADGLGLADGRPVDEASGLDPCVVALPTVMGSARGGS
jgi:hypothetical protein